VSCRHGDAGAAVVRHLPLRVRSVKSDGYDRRYRERPEDGVQRGESRARIGAPECDAWPTAAAARPPVLPLLRAWSEFDDLLASAPTAGIEALERRRRGAEAQDGFVRPAFRAQDADLLADGLHYETRIAERGIVATRERCAHDVFNALVWLRHVRLKRALNARQAADIRVVGPKRRTRGQCALTHFDEAGAIVWLADPALLPLWDAHDWPALFVRERAAWGTRIALTVVGHALIEHVCDGLAWPVAKALVARVPAGTPMRAGGGALLVHWPAAEALLAAAIADGRLLADPLELRPLPLAGIPGWLAGRVDEAFFRDAPCFRPRREGRRYPPPADLHGVARGPADPSSGTFR
jgi:hypothetical protein